MVYTQNPIINNAYISNHNQNNLLFGFRVSVYAWVKIPIISYPKFSQHEITIYEYQYLALQKTNF